LPALKYLQAHKERLLAALVKKTEQRWFGAMYHVKDGKKYFNILMEQ
jgi:hypothetical protein